MITDKEAKIISTDWHGGQRSPLYALSSTGSIVDGIVDELDDIISHTPASETKALWALYLYVRNRIAMGNVRAVPKWDSLHW